MYNLGLKTFSLPLPHAKHTFRANLIIIDRLTASFRASASAASICSVVSAMAFSQQLQQRPCSGSQRNPNLGSIKPKKVGRAVLAPASSNGTSWETTDIFGTTAVLGPEMNRLGSYSMPEGRVEAPTAEVEAILEEQGIDLEISGLKYMNNEGRVRFTILNKHKWSALCAVLFREQ